ncbi:hypothetical protein [Listeria sp. PSOL-1]|uniref:hypothetical protein n=1 Tax=Listeria sp. PSOL-1 TaxID=1844999 RepID=UPI0013D16B67|nr:hypothetical protein [Listeria sp. PSOL-1]
MDSDSEKLLKQILKNYSAYDGPQSIKCLTDKEKEDAQEIILNYFLDYGLDENDEATAYGRKIDSLIDYFSDEIDDK